MKRRWLCLLIPCLLASPAAAQTPAPPDAPPIDLNAMLQEAYQAEERSTQLLREIRAIEAATLMQVPIEDALDKIEIAMPQRQRLALQDLARRARGAEDAEHQKELLRQANDQLDNILRTLEELLADLQKAEQEEAAINVERMFEESRQFQDLEDMAREDEKFRAVDLTDLMRQEEPPPPPELDPVAQARQVEREAHELIKELEQLPPKVIQEPPEPPPKATTDTTKATDQATVDATDATPPASTDATTQATTDATTEASTGATTQATTEASTEQGESSTASTDSGDSGKSSTVQAKAYAQQAESTAQDAQQSGLTSGQAAGLVQTAKNLLAKAQDAAGDETGGSAATGKTGGRFNSPNFKSGTLYQVGALPGRRLDKAGRDAQWMYLDTWYIIGPFPNPGRRNVDKEFPPNTVVDLDARYPGKDGQMVGWQFLQSSRPDIIPPWRYGTMIYYAYTEVWSNEQRDLWVALGSDDNSRVWFNDQLIWKSNYRLKPWRPDEGYRKVTFRKGINRILYRVENGSFITEFSFIIAVNETAQPNLPIKRYQRPSRSSQ